MVKLFNPLAIKYVVSRNTVEDFPSENVSEVDLLLPRDAFQIMLNAQKEISTAKLPLRYRIFSPFSFFLFVSTLGRKHENHKIYAFSIRRTIERT